MKIFIQMKVLKVVYIDIAQIFINIKVMKYIVFKNRRGRVNSVLISSQMPKMIRIQI